MKMSDVFALPVKRVGNTLADQGGYADGEDEASAAAHAINQHDALVEALAALLAAAESEGLEFMGYKKEIKQARDVLRGEK